MAPRTFADASATNSAVSLSAQSNTSGSVRTNIPTAPEDPVISLPSTVFPKTAYLEPANLLKVYPKADMSTAAGVTPHSL